MKNKEKILWWMICGMAVIVLGVSVWAVFQEVKLDTKEKTVSIPNTPEPDLSPKKGKNINVSQLVHSILSQVTFETKLSKMKDNVAKNMVTPSEKSTKVLLYMGEGTCADEILIITAASEKEAKLEMPNVKQHLKDMKQSFQDYLPKQADKVKKAVIQQRGKYIVACVCSKPEKVEELLETAWK
jgi:hypothetical protein